ncbi:HDOD domain-containing protein, partial [bacterium]
MDAEFILVRRSLEGSIKELPPLPTAVLKILEVMARPDPSANDIEAVVASDPALTAKMLRVVNSAYYGLARQISNVGQAVVILGLQQVRNVTLAVGASSTFKGSGERQQERLNEFWVHAFGTSATAGLLAGRQGL